MSTFVTIKFALSLKPRCAQSATILVTTTATSLDNCEYCTPEGEEEKDILALILLEFDPTLFLLRWLLGPDGSGLLPTLWSPIPLRREETEEMEEIEDMPDIFDMLDMVDILLLLLLLLDDEDDMAPPRVFVVLG
jgi:hypothetical protein